MADNIPLRIAHVSVRVKRSLDPDRNAPEVWVTETREELQWRRPSGEWIPIPHETLPLDDREERMEREAEQADSQKHKDAMTDRIQRAKELKLVYPNNDWVVCDIEEEFHAFVESQEGEITEMSEEGHKVYHAQHGSGDPIARFRKKEFEVRAVVFANWLDPFAFTLSC